MDTGALIEAAMSGFRDAGIAHRMPALTGAILTTTVIQMAGIITAGIGTEKITATSATTVRTTAKTIVMTIVEITGTNSYTLEE